MNKDAPSNLTGLVVPTPKKNGAQLLSPWYRRALCSAATAIFNLKVIQRYSDGTNSLPAQYADVIATEMGITVNLPPVAMPGGAGGAGVVIQQFLFNSDQGDYVDAYVYDGTRTSGSLIKLAKPYPIRTSITSEVIGGVTHNYTYATSGGIYTRTDTAGSVVETQTINPPFLSDSVIYGISGFTTTAPASLTSVTYLMLPDGRSWAR